jgi:hypothetical protein
MRIPKMFTWLALTGMLVSGAASLRADEGRELRHRREAIERLRSNVARDRMRLDEDQRRGRRRAAERDARDLARYERALADLERGFPRHR